MEENLIVESLSPMERSILPVLTKDFTNIDEASKDADLDKTTALRAVGFLNSKGLVESESSEKSVVILGILGVNYVKKEWPEIEAELIRTTLDDAAKYVRGSHGILTRCAAPDHVSAD